AAGRRGLGPVLPKAVGWLPSLRSHNPDSVNTVRLFFSRLGAAVLSRYAATEGQRTIRTELAARDEQLAQVTGDVARLSGELAQSEQQFAVVQADLSRLSDALKTSEEVLTTRTAEAEQLASS